MTGRIERAIDVFLKALENGTLAPGTCTACAVGNLVSHARGGVIIKHELSLPFNDEKGIYFGCNVTNDDWSWILGATEGEVKEYATDNPDGCQTEFTMMELYDIERAFESNTHMDVLYYSRSTPKEIRKDQMRGLEAVVEVMLGFDDCKEKVQEVFTAKAELIPV